MSATAMTGTVESVPPTADAPPIATLLPLFQLVLAGSSLLFRSGVRFLLAMVYPLHFVWSILLALLSPTFVAIKITFAIVLSTPFSIIRMVAVALYPVYVFCAVACITGAAIGFLGRYISNAILSALAQSAYFTRPPSPPLAARPSTPQAMLRRRKRKSVRLQ